MTTNLLIQLLEVGGIALTTAVVLALLSWRAGKIDSNGRP